MFVNDLFKLIENSNEEYYAVYNQRGKPMIMRKPVGKTARAYAEEKNLTIKGGPFDSHQETESFWIRSVFTNKRKEVDEQAPVNVPQGWQATTQPDGSTRISKQGSMSSAEYKQNMADYKAKNWTPEKIADYGQRMASGQGYTDAERQANLQQQQQHFGKYADTGDLKETEPTTNQPRTGLSAEQKAQLRKDVDAVDYNKQQQPPAASSREQKAGIRQAVSDYNKDKKVDEAGPFSYGTKKPRRGSVADLAAKKRKEQEKGKQPIEPKDQRVGVAKVVKEFLDDRNQGDDDGGNGRGRKSPKARARAQMLKMYGDGDITFRKTSNGGYFIQHEDDIGDTHSHQYDPQTGQVDFSSVTRSSYYGEGVAEGSDNIEQIKAKIRELEAEQEENKYGSFAYDSVDAELQFLYGKLDKIKKQGVAEGLPQTLRKVVPGYARREIDKKMDAEKFGRTDVDRDANYYRYKKIQDKIKNKGVAEGGFDIPEIPRAPQPRPEPKNKTVGEDASEYMDTNPGSVTAKQADELGAMARKAFRPDLNPDYYKDNEPVRPRRNWDYDDPDVQPIVKQWMDKNLIDRKPMTYQQGIDEDFDDLDRFMKDKYGPKPSGGGGIKRGTYGQPGRARGRKKGELSGAFHQGGGSDIPHNVGFDRSHSERSAGRRMPRFSDDYDSIKRSEVDEDFDDKSPHSTYVQSIRTLTNKDGDENYKHRVASLSTDKSGNQRVRALDTSREFGDELTINANIPKGVTAKIVPQQGNVDIDEGSVQDKLHKRHQELRKKRGAPDPEYYKQLGKSYDIEDDQQRHAHQAELKKKYGVTNEDRERYVEELGRAGYEIVTESATLCPECGGVAYENQILAEKQDACYHKVKSRYKVWPSAYASGALVRCRKKGAANWGNKSKK